MAYGGGFLDETWTRTGGDFKAELKKLGVEVIEYNILEKKELVEKCVKGVDPYNPFSNHARFVIDEKDVSKDEFFQVIHRMREGLQ
jgi:hypothetical protein